MRTVNFTKFRNNASLYLTEVEKGETIKIIRHGKLIAKISPPSASKKKEPSWKNEGLRLIIKKKNLSSAILEEREAE